MKLHRIKAIVRRLWINSFLNPGRLFEDIYWPILDIMLWGLASTWLNGTQTTGTANLVMVVMTCLVFWTVIIRSNQEISYTMLWDLWDRNFVNLFATPLTLGEWITAAMILGLAKVGLVIVVGTLTVGAMYNLNILTGGWSLIPLGVQLILFGWSLGFASAAMLIYWGQRIQSLVFALWWAAAPFSTVFYPLEVLPGWMRVIAVSLPPAHVFTGMRSVLAGNGMPWQSLSIACALNAVYLTGSVTLFYVAFEKSKAKGLGRLE